MPRLLPLLVVAACATPTLEVFEVCELDVALTPEEGPPGAVIVARGGPFTEVRDTRVQIGGFDAEVLSVDALVLGTGDTAATDVALFCSECETCRAEAGCAPCGRCAGELLEPSRRVECFGDPFEGTTGYCDLCQQQVSFAVPEVAPGPTTVWMVNGNGASPPVPFTVLGAQATGVTGNTADTGSTDTTGDTSSTPTTNTADTSDTGT